MKWDSTKKRYVTKKIDSDRNVIKEKRNESGAKITKKGALKNQTEQMFYKKWMKKTHLKLQQTGEIEDNKLVEKARSSTDSIKMMKQFKKKHDLNKGEDAKSNNKLVQMKKKKLLSKMKSGKNNNKRGSHGFGEKVGDKQMRKIVGNSKPTRSKIITKRR